MPIIKTKKNICFRKLCHQKGLESTWKYVRKSLAVHFDTSVVYSIILCYWLDIPGLELQFQKPEHWQADKVMLHRIAENSLLLVQVESSNTYSSSKKIVLTKLLTFYSGCCLRIPNFAALNDDHSLNMLDFHMNKVPTLQTAWAIKIN